MKILFLSHYFPPEVNAPAVRTYEHCKYWVEQGHEVTVVSCVPHHPVGEVFPGYKNRVFQEEQRDGIRAVKILTYVTANQGFLGRTVNYVFYMLMAFLVAPFLGKHDIVVSTSPQFFNGLAGFLVARLRRVPWVLEIRDLWPESILAVGALDNSRAIGFLERLERFAYRNADHIISVTDSFVEHIVANGANPESVSVIKNGCNLEQFNRIAPDRAFAEELGVADKFVVSYVGTLGMAHGLESLLDAAERLKNETDIVFLIVGDGAQKSNLEEGIRSRTLENVKMLGLLPKEKMPQVWSVSSLSLVLLKKLPLFKKVIPSKIFESMAMAKPIVLGVEGESAQIISESGAGVCIEPENAEQLAETILRLKNDNEEYAAMAAAGPDYVSAHFDRRKLAQRFLDKLQSLLSA